MMQIANLSGFEDLKCKQFKRMFGDKCSLVSLGFNCWTEKDGRVLGEISFCFSEWMTVLKIQSICEEIAEWMGGDLYGTVNIDFSGNTLSLEMVVEVHNNAEL